MRGKDRRWKPRSNLRRITPAYAGKSRDTALCSLLHEDHPRLCGEKRRNSRLSQALPGSPPPMRGKDMDDLVDDIVPRITPAYAGKSTVQHGRFDY